MIQTYYTVVCKILMYVM